MVCGFVGAIASKVESSSRNTGDEGAIAESGDQYEKDKFQVILHEM